MTKHSPLLSICIPTYNRAGWLKTSLAHWVPQIEQMDGVVELVISDNCSTDETLTITDSIQKSVNIIINRNGTNIGGNPNCHKCSQLSRGKFVWVVGDDDLPRKDAVQRVIRAIVDNPDIDFFHINHGLYFTGETPPKDIPVETLSPIGSALDPNLEDRRVERLLEWMPGDYTCFTGIYTFIMPRDSAISAFAGSLNSVPFENLSSVLSHSQYIADHFLFRPAYIIGYPCLSTSTNLFWPHYLPTFYYNTLPQLFDYYEMSGAPRKTMNKYRRKYLLQPAAYFWPLLTNRETIGRKQFRFSQFFIKHCIFYELWLLLISQLLRFATPRPIRELVYKAIIHRQQARGFKAKNRADPQ